MPFQYSIFSSQNKSPSRTSGSTLSWDCSSSPRHFAGWIMVASGLVDRPSVSHFNLTIHLLLALTLLGLSLWTALGHQYGFPPKDKKVKWSLPSKLAWSRLPPAHHPDHLWRYDGGLKAGHVSDTWPLMFGRLIPPNLFNSLINLLEAPQTIVFVHRWFAFAVFLAVMVFYFVTRSQSDSAEIRSRLELLLALVAFQIPGYFDGAPSCANCVALAHQAGALCLFSLMIYFIHRLRAMDFVG